ncbi:MULTISPECIES: hypothetical protein [unclassified Thermosynechococcus]|uniref:hypothetical protein n=1 Tax=unclassified Thermosynechococcus TaxID=2622553 RepID=UPI002670D66F|nr:MULTISPECIES: hypothetical protein [unclassified Thermosynechococcus]WKT82985.1 hypothetical protein QYC28_09130 [Thermosynechococcus sp. HY596]WNC62113.1 hypothetical protein RHK13_09125 [Thermosynechococcus sp. HY591]WNC64666.1 hypothetical protein RHK28_09155 [Thermosynechococcus sp. HY593]
MENYPFDLDVLLSPTALIFIAVLIAGVRSSCGPGLTLALALLKSGLYFVYYGFLFDGTFTFLDDWTYLEGVEHLLDQEAGLFELFGSEFLFLVANGDHVVYYLYNALAMSWFGRGYYAPVALNIVLTVVIARLGVQLLVSEGLISQRQRSLFFAFIVLHPDILAWSTVMNGKDILVFLLHVLLLMSVAWFLRGQRWSALVLAAASSFVLLFLRFYVPILFGVALVTAVVVTSPQRGIKLVLPALFLLGIALSRFGIEGIEYAIHAVREDFVNPLYGFFRFVLTPIPFNTEEAYAFLDLPAILHWLLLPAVVLGIWKLYHRNTAFSHFLIVYTILFVGLYAVYGELQGPRHRVQLDFAWATFQFLGLSLMLCTRRLSKLPNPGDSNAAVRRISAISRK